MKFKNFLNELSSDYGIGCNFVDIDETIFNTFAQIIVRNKNTNEIVKKLTNSQFNHNVLRSDEYYDFSEFKSAELFNKTSKPILPTISRLKRIFKNIELRGSRVIFLTARSDLDDKDIFLDTFRQFGIPIDKIYVERAGNIQASLGISIPEAKKRIIFKWINKLLPRRVRIIDDHLPNVKSFLELENELPPNIIDKVKEKHNITGPESLKPIEFYGLLVKPNGSLQRITL